MQAEIDEKSGACSVVYLAVGDKLTGALCISDPPRPEAEEAVKQLKEAGITNIVMLTGDSAKAAEITAQKLGISDFRAQRWICSEWVKDLSLQRASLFSEEFTSLRLWRTMRAISCLR